MGSIVSAITGSGSKKAASAQAKAGEQAIKIQEQTLAEQVKLARESLDLQKQALQTSLDISKPYRAAGEDALSKYESLLYGTPVDQTPSYKARAVQTQQADRQSVYNELLPQYTKKGTQSNSNMYISPDGRLIDITSPEAASAFTTSAGGYNERRPWEGAGAPSWVIEKQIQSNPEEFFTSRGYKPYQSQTAQDTIDYQGLNSAVDQRIAGMPNSAPASDSQPFQFQTTPGYEFRRDEGAKALERSAAARSGVLSGAQLKGQERYAQDYATGEYDNVLRRIGGLVDTGASMSTGAANNVLGSANSQSGVLGQQAGYQGQYGSNVSDLTTNIGQAKASGYLGQQAQGTSLLNNIFGFMGGMA